MFLLREVSRDASSVHAWSEYLQKEVTLEPTFLKPALRGRSISRYEIVTRDVLLLVPYEAVNGHYVLVPESRIATVAPLTLDYLRACKSQLEQREHGRFKGMGWHCYGRPQNIERMDRASRIVFPDVARAGTCYLDMDSHWLLDTCYAIVPKSGIALDLRYLLGILNSPLLTYFLHETGTALRGGYFRMKTAYLNPFPLRPIDFNNSADKAMHDEMVRLVDQMLTLHRQLAVSGTDREKSGLQLQIAALDRAIDSLVFRMYGFSQQEEITVTGIHSSNSHEGGHDD